MNIHTSLQEIPPLHNLVLTIGTFDGVHKGHKKLIDSILQKAKAVNGTSGLLTFHPHPRMVIRKKDEPVQLLTPIEERIEKLQATRLDNLFIVPFNVEFANMSAEQYVEEVLLNQLQARFLVIGYDHKFGKNRSGNIDLLLQMSEEMNFDVEQIPRQQIDEITYSSTTIRNLLLEGEVKSANDLLGSAYKIEGVVVHGEKRGRDLGYPTANIKTSDAEKLIPGKGVYAVRTEFNGTVYNGMLNIGTRPTFDGQRKTIENVLFDFSGDLYGHKITVKFVQKIRSEHKFASAEELKSQLICDEAKAKMILEND